MTDKLMEAVAEAMWNTHAGSRVHPWAALGSIKDDYRDYARAALAAVEAAGYRVVPVEPTAEMIRAALVEADRHGYLALKGYFTDDEATFCWRAMLAAAPPPEGRT